MSLLTERVDGAIAAGFCGYEYTRPFKRVCEGHVAQHPPLVSAGMRREPLIDDHTFIPTYYVPIDEPWPDGLIVPRTGRLRPTVRAALRDAIKPSFEHRGSRIEVLNPERGYTLDWQRLDSLRLPLVPPYVRGPFRMRIRRVVQVGMFHTSRMQPSGAERMATCWPDGTATLDYSDDDDG